MQDQVNAPPARPKSESPGIRASRPRIVSEGICAFFAENEARLQAKE